jgi:uncharacterized protein YaiI (UPF0178 family)
MVPRIAKGGRSFKGAWLYYFHDKGALSAERVAFTHTENVPTRDPEKAYKWMAYTALHQKEIKVAAGGSLKGRKLAASVYAYSLSWHPEENPAREQMIEAARASLKAQNMDGYEVIMAAHKDEPQPHIHIIVNRVHPETGVAHDLKYSKEKLSRWAEAYEKEHGKIYCEERVQNNKQRDKDRQRRRKGEKVKYKRHKGDRSKEEFHRWQREKVKQDHERQQDEKKALSTLQVGQRKALYAAKERRIEEARQTVKDQYRLRWHALYKQQAQEQENLKELQTSAWKRLRYLLTNRQLDRFQDGAKGHLARRFNAVLDHTVLSEALDKRHTKERARLSTEQKAVTRDAMKGINMAYRADLQKLKGLQNLKQQHMDRQHSLESQQGAKDIKQGRTYQDYLRDKTKADFERAHANDNSREISHDRGTSDHSHTPGDGGPARSRGRRLEP